MKPFAERIHLEQNEEIIKIVRKHWFILMRDTAVPLLLLIVPTSVYLFAGDVVLGIPLLQHFHYANTGALFLVSAWGLIAWMMLFLVWTDYYLDMWIITDQRIITIDQQGFFRRIIASFRYERMQDISIEINGFIPTMLDFGNIRAQTAGHEVDFRMNGAPNPRDIKALILEAADKIVAERHAELHEAGFQDHRGGL
ncbi:PH domain-containing protein [Candidatus Kaiserbacteria bacterium]|nr:PH domain-containing protein [Candidatus Kaiserbacteria bacterium]